MIRKLGFGMFFPAALAAVAPVLAHHGTSVNYDHSQTVTVEGTVKIA